MNGHNNGRAKYYIIEGEFDDPIIKKQKRTIRRMYMSSSEELARIQFLQEIGPSMKDEQGELKGDYSIRIATPKEVSAYKEELKRFTAPISMR